MLGGGARDITDHAAVGDARVAAAPRPAHTRVEDGCTHFRVVRRFAMTCCALAAHSIGRQCQHERRLIPAGVDFRQAGVRYRAHQCAYMQDAGVQLEFGLEFVGEALQGGHGCRRDR